MDCGLCWPRIWLYWSVKEPDQGATSSYCQYCCSMVVVSIKTCSCLPCALVINSLTLSFACGKIIWFMWSSCFSSLCCCWCSSSSSSCCCCSCFCFCPGVWSVFRFSCFWEGCPFFLKFCLWFFKTLFPHPCYEFIVMVVYVYCFCNLFAAIGMELLNFIGWSFYEFQSFCRGIGD